MVHPIPLPIDSYRNLYKFTPAKFEQPYFCPNLSSNFSNSINKFINIHTYDETVLTISIFIIGAHQFTNFRFTNHISSQTSSSQTLQFTNLISSQTISVHKPFSSQTASVHKPLQFTNCFSSQTASVHKLLQFTNRFSSQTASVHKPLQFTNCFSSKTFK